MVLTRSRSNTVSARMLRDGSPRIALTLALIRRDRRTPIRVGLTARSKSRIRRSHSVVSMLHPAREGPEYLPIFIFAGTQHQLRSPSKWCSQRTPVSRPTSTAVSRESTARGGTVLRAMPDGRRSMIQVITCIHCSAVTSLPIFANPKLTS